MSTDASCHIAHFNSDLFIVSVKHFKTAIYKAIQLNLKKTSVTLINNNYYDPKRTN